MVAEKLKKQNENRGDFHFQKALDDIAEVNYSIRKREKEIEKLKLS